MMPGDRGSCVPDLGEQRAQISALLRAFGAAMVAALTVAVAVPIHPVAPFDPPKRLEPGVNIGSPVKQQNLERRRPHLRHNGAGFAIL